MTAARQVETTSLSARVVQGVMALVLAVLSVLLMITTHRLELGIGGVELPIGLLFGAIYQVVTCVFLWAATGSRFPLLVLGCLWGMIATPFLGEGAGGGVLMPAVVRDQQQYSGWIVQGLGLVIPFLIAGVLTLRGRRSGRGAR